MEVVQEAPGVTAAAMRAAGLRAPLPCHTPETIAHNGQCFRMRTGTGEAVFVLRKEGAVLWVDGFAATVRSAGLTEQGWELAEAIARQCGCTEIAFETTRGGLVRKAKAAGYRTAAYVMKRSLT